MRNTEKVIDVSLLDSNEKKIKARDFSEGNGVLDELLNRLWDKGIKTTGCCAGHQNNKIAYIEFMINTVSFKLPEITQMHRIINRLQRFDIEDLEIDISCLQNDDVKITYYCKEEDSYRLFSIMRDVLKNDEFSFDDHLFTILNMNSIINSSGYNTRICFNKNKCILGIHKPEEIVMLDKPIDTLKNINQQLIESGTKGFPTGVIDASFEDIRDWINIMEDRYQKQNTL